MSGAAADPEPQKPAANPAAPPAATWLTNLADGRAQAQRRRQPVLVRVVTSSCPWCRKLEDELKKPAAADELGRWTLVLLDAERNDRDADALAVGAVPALRILTPAGKQVADREGFATSDELAAWLKKNYDAATTTPATELTADGAPDAVAVTRLVAGLNQRDPLLRETAVRRLLPVPGLAAAPVAQVFRTGPLQSRLAALELLREWDAPVGGLDPWRVDTLTADRLTALQGWAVAAGSRPSASSPGWTATRREAARRDLARFVVAPEEETAALRERLARHGSVLLPDIHELMKTAATDSARERLTALRYRLAQTDALAFRWPGGVERLAATAAGTRHQAVQALTQQATAAEEPLLLELFSNPDPLVRELSLRALHAVAGRRAGAALTGLLRDPDPNVRAAVLKQLAERPSAGMVAKVVDYLGGESDPDLVVHGVRVLRNAKTAAAVGLLKKLLKHNSWRVRAEAVETLAELGEGHQNPLADDVYAALVEALKDPDGFVVGRSAEALKKLDREDSIEPLLAVARSHPELTAEVVTVLGNGSAMAKKAVVRLHEFCRHDDPEVRARALAGVCGVESEPPVEVLRTALQDKAPVVRKTAANQTFLLLYKARSEWERKERHNRRGAPLMEADAPRSLGLFEAIQKFFTGEGGPESDAEALLKQVLAGQGRPKALNELTPLLVPLLNAKATDERLAAALALVAFGHSGQAVPVLADAARKEPGVLAQAAAAIEWLPLMERLAFYRQLLALNPKTEDLGVIVQSLARVPASAVEAPLWELAARPNMPPEMAQTLINALEPLLVPDSQQMQSLAAPKAKAVWERFLGTVQPRAETGPELQRLVALALLAKANVKEATDVADKIAAEAGAAVSLREDAFRASLWLRRPRAATRVAVAALSHPDVRIRKVALIYLALGADTVQQLSGGQIYLSSQYRDSVDSRSDSGPAALEPPSGLPPEVPRQMLTDPDPAVAALAGYLLTQFGDPAGFGPLERFWRDRVREDSNWTRLVYRAVAALNDDARVPILQEIYRDMVPEEGEPVALGSISEFYWTIRVLDGPNVLQLRKRIRAEVGKDALR
jgi:HEAT repeat protein